MHSNEQLGWLELTCRTSGGTSTCTVFAGEDLRDMVDAVRSEKGGHALRELASPVEPARVQIADGLRLREARPFTTRAMRTLEGRPPRKAPAS